MHNISPQVERQFVSTYEQAINTGMEKGIQQGIQRGIIKTAKNLKKMGLDMQIISKSTGLPLAEIKKL